MARTYQIITLFARDTILRNVTLAMLGLSSSRWNPIAVLDQQHHGVTAPARAAHREEAGRHRRLVIPTAIWAPNCTRSVQSRAQKPFGRYGRCEEALRPACASWMQNLAVPLRRQCATMRAKAASLSSE